MQIILVKKFIPTALSGFSKVKTKTEILQNITVPILFIYREDQPVDFDGLYAIGLEKYDRELIYFYKKDSRSKFSNK